MGVVEVLRLQSSPFSLRLRRSMVNSGRLLAADDDVLIYISEVVI
jgi:hypothetical protein